MEFNPEIEFPGGSTWAGFCVVCEITLTIGGLKMTTIDVFKFDELDYQIQQQVHEKYAHELCNYGDCEWNDLHWAIVKVWDDLGIEVRNSYYNQEDYRFTQETSWDWGAGPQKMRRLFLENLPDVHEYNFWTETIVSEILTALRRKRNKDTTDVMRDALDSMNRIYDDYMCDYYDFDQFEYRMQDSDCYFTADGVYVGDL